EGYLQGLAKLYAALGLSGQNGPASAEIANVDAGTSPFLRTWWYMQEFTTDEVKWTQSDPGTPELSYTNYGTVNNPIISGLYYRLMFTISLCNDYLKQTTDENVKSRGHDDQLLVIQQYRSEARFLRALMYYYGLDVFGNMPFVTEADPIGSYIPPQYSRKQLFEYIEDELLFLENDPNLKEPHQNLYGRADKSAVWMLLSRLYLNAEIYLSELSEDGDLVAKGNAHYEACKTYAQKIIDLTNFSLCPNYAHLFMADNGENPDARKEIIFSINFDGRWTQSYATQFLVDGSRGPNDNSFTKTSGVSKTFKGSRATLTFIRHFWPEIDQWMTNGKITDVSGSYTWSDGDPLGFDYASQGTLGAVVRQSDNRALFFTRQCTLPMSQNAGSSTFIYGWPSYKFSNITSTGTIPYYVDENENNVDLIEYPSLDYPLMRLAEAYLNYAEACVRITGGDCTDSKALSVLNELRDRAGITTDHITEFNLEYIFGERSRELYWEGFRRTDLIRWDRFAGSNYNWEFKNGVTEGSPVPYFRCLFPIPISDLGVNINLKQNPGYSGGN
ncbi:MAG: RagB/SusD family nutrient uptake outer membrane protein, partial [Ignavibacteriaceae bacterium]|nr:RagB/SusD family nutrient uptake outer membrane protein [Ignavibacteriaceae bacterium]